jgi:hypothetical protein
MDKNQKLNPKVVELVEKIKLRDSIKGKCDFLETIRKQGISFASGNGMTLKELTDFIKKTENSRKQS